MRCMSAPPFHVHGPLNMRYTLLARDIESFVYHSDKLSVEFAWRLIVLVAAF